MKLYHTLGGQYLIHGKEFPKGTICFVYPHVRLLSTRTKQN